MAKKKRSEKTFILRAQWTDKLKKDVLEFVNDEEKKYPPSPFEDFPEHWHKEGDTLFWKDMEVIATPDERKKLLKKIFYDESLPKGMTAMVRYVNENYVGFKARKVKEWIRTQQSYQDSRKVYTGESTASFIVPKELGHVVEVDVMFYSQHPQDLKANSGRYLLLTFIETFSKWGFADWISATSASETIRVFKKFLKEAPFKPQICLTDNGSEFSHDKFTSYLQSIKITHKRQPTGTPAKHIENFNLNVRRAATQFRTRYDTRRIKDYVKVYIKRYNNTIHGRTKASPNKVVQMDPEELDQIKKTSIDIATNRSEKRGRRLRKIRKGDKVRIVDEKHRKRREKVKASQSHTPPGLRWGKTVYTVLKVKKGSVQLKRGIEPEWIQRPYVQLISEHSEQRKEYKDRPELSDEFDPEKAERGTPEQRAKEKAKPKSKETERLLAEAKQKKIDAAKEKLDKKQARKKKRAVRKARKINKPVPKNQHTLAQFFKAGEIQENTHIVL